MMLTHSLKTIPLRSVLVADAVVCGASSLLALAGAGVLADSLDLPAALLRAAGLLLIPYVAYLAVLVRRDPLPASGVWGAIGVNVAWAVGCLAVLLSGQVAPNALGVAFVLVQVAAVLLFAELQLLGLRSK